MRRFLVVLFLLVMPAVNALAQVAPRNLLLNPGFEFHSFENSRNGDSQSWRSGSVACWNQDKYDDAEVMRAPNVKVFRPGFPVNSVVVIHPGKTLYQFSLLAEMMLDHGDRVSLSVFGYQSAPDALEATIHQMRVDSASGEWSPADFGQADARKFPRHSRGELVKGQSVAAKSGAKNDFEIKIENDKIVGAFTEAADTSTDQPNTIGLQVEFTNNSNQDVYIYAPCLSKSAIAVNDLPAARPLPDYYRSIPRTIQKLWRGEPLHIMVMGSSIDRGSANPPPYKYDEDPKSKTFKQPISAPDLRFNGKMVGHPEWNDYIGQWRHYYMYAGQLRLALMQKFNYPIDKLLLNTMARDGSSISESHSGLADYASLILPPDPEVNGQAAGKTWQELYPQVFSRPEGPRPDLVIFGSGANEKVDGADETAHFEAQIRWFQRHYPGTEFLFCMWQNREGYTRNTGGLMELSLRYQIPYVDFGRAFNLATRHANSYALTPADGHPQATGHYLWFKQIERAFDVADPIQAGIAQLQLPERLNPFTIGLEGEMTTYTAGEPRLHQDKAFIFDDSAINMWATTSAATVAMRIDGIDTGGGRPFAARDIRNSTFAIGRLSLGDRHVIEVTGADSKLVAVDGKTALNRQWIGTESPRWQLTKKKPIAFASQWGAPYGARQVILAAGASAEVEAIGTDFSVAYVDQQNGGTLVTTIDGVEKLKQATNVPLTVGAGPLFMENRRGIRGLPYGLHRLKIQAVGGPVALLGLFTYDTRANQRNERVIRGQAFPGETIQITAPFKARPIVICSGGLEVATADITESSVKFKGRSAGTYEIIGE